MFGPFRLPILTSHPKSRPNRRPPLLNLVKTIRSDRGRGRIALNRPPPEPARAIARRECPAGAFGFDPLALFCSDCPLALVSPSEPRASHIPSLTPQPSAHIPYNGRREPLLDVCAESRRQAFAAAGSDRALARFATRPMITPRRACVLLSRRRRQLFGRRLVS